jgi:two-component system, NtrC family, sensor kinase
MEDVRANEHCLLLKVAVVARGYRALSVMRMLSDIKPGRLRLQLVAIATINKSIACSKFAGEVGVAVYDNPMDLLAVEHLDLILEMTGDAQTLARLAGSKPSSIGVLDRQASMLIFDIAGLYQQASARESEISLASSFASALLEASPDGVMVVDRDYRIINCNASPIVTGGKGREFALGRYCYELIHHFKDICSKNDLRCPMEEVLQTGRPARTVHETKPGSPDTRVHQSTAYPLTNSVGEIVQVVVSIRDITQELTDRVEQRTQAIKNDLEQFVREDRLASLGRLVASVCHEINNPIASILTFNKLILRCIQEDDMPEEGISSFSHYLDICVREALRCGQIVKNLLTFARQKNIELIQIDLKEMIDTILVLTGHQLEMNGITCDLNLPQSSFTAKGDYTQIQQCLMNLIFNAVESMTDGGTLTLSGGQDRDGKTVWVNVADTGFGIDPEDLPRIFEPFYTTKKEGKGVGLGLSMVYGIIREHEGTVEVQSEPGKGSLFKLTLPAGVETVQKTEGEDT